MRLRTAFPVQEARESWDSLLDIEEGPPVPKNQVRKSDRTRKTQMSDLGRSSSFPRLTNTTMIKMAVKKREKENSRRQAVKHFFWYMFVLIVTASLIKVWSSPMVSIIGPIIGPIPIPTWKTLTERYATEIPSSVFELSTIGTTSPSDFQLFTPTAPSCNKHLDAKFVSFTLVSQLSDDQLWMVQYHCERWEENPMSIVVFTDRTAASVKSELVLMGCSEHLTLQTVRKTYDPSGTEHLVNLLRNMALSAVKTSHFVYVDVDFWPSTNLRSILSDKKTRVRFASDPKLAAVIPAFQLHQRCRDDNKYCREKNIQMMPEEKDALMKSIGTREASTFDPTNEASHGSTKYAAWKDQRRGTFVDLPCIKSERYEPFLALRYCRELPPFQEGFATGHGQDKTSWVMHLRRAGYLFSQIGEAFFVHYPHTNRVAEVDDEADYAGEADDPETDASEAYHGTDNSKTKAGNSSDNSDDDDSDVNTKPSRKLLQNSEMMMRTPVDTLFSDFEPWLNVVVGDESRVPLCEMALIHEEDLSAKQESREMEDEKKKDEQNAGELNFPIVIDVVDDGCDSFQRQVDEIQVHVIGWKRPQPIKDLLNQLEESNYRGWNTPIPLYVHLDGGALREVITIVNEFEWTHGVKRLNDRQENVGLREMWFSSIGSASKMAGENTLMLVFEDDMSVSLDYFQWLLAVVDAYGRNPRCRDANLMGFSLSPIRVEEMRKPFTRWDASTVIQDGRNAYLSTVPGSWGAAYWSDKWNEFAEFVDVRMKPPYYDVQAEHLEPGQKYNYDELRLTPKELFIPDARSNVWPKSWKRFMVDFMYVRGQVMLYPNLPGEMGLATTLALAGEHIDASSTLKNPRVADLMSDSSMVRRSLHMYKDLDVLDLHLEPTTREQLAFLGTQFLHGVKASCSGCNELLRAWARPGTHLDQKDGDSLSICAPDLYSLKSSSSPFSNVETSSIPQAQNRYLLFEPQYGTNNQFAAIVEAMKWARALDRQLVMPPIFIPRPIDFSKVLEWPLTESLLKFEEFDGPGHYQQPLGFQEWLKLKIPVHRKLRISRLAVFDESTRLLTNAILKASHAPSGTDIPTVDVQHLFAKSPTVLSDEVKFLLGGCNDQVLAFETLYFANMKNNATWIDNFVLMNGALKLSDKAAKTYDTVKLHLHEKLGQSTYACYHVRLGDFVSFCDEVSHSKNPRYAYFASLLDQNYKCAVSADDLVSAITDVGLPALIMTNDMTLIEDKLKTSAMATASSEWVQKKVSEHLPFGMNEAENQLLSLLIEQELCAEAEYSRLNRFSTYSKRIEYKRKASGAPFDHWSLNVKGTNPNGTGAKTTEGLVGGGMLTSGKTDSKVNGEPANSNPAESLQVDSQEEATEISIGRSLLDDPETKSEAHLIACVNGAPLRRILVREHLGIAKATAEDFFARFLPRMSEKHIVLDIGANTGQFAVPLASLGHTVISFEPSQATCDVLRKNLENANVTNRVEVHCAPAAKLVETLLFHADPVSSARNGLISPEEAEVLKKSGRGSEVTMKTSVTVDLSVGDRDVFLLKTDTQGYEMSVLEGATRVLKMGNVKFMLIEFSYSLLNKAGTSPINLINFVYDHGYMCTYLGFHTVTQKVKGKSFFSMVDAPQFDKDRLSVSFEMFVKSLEIVAAPDAPYLSPGWSDLFCWKRCML